MILSCLIGFILGIIFFWKYNKKFKGPDSNIVKNKIYKFNNKCYKFIPSVCFCPLI